MSKQSITSTVSEAYPQDRTRGGNYKWPGV